ncbi:MAG: hypothetical protein NTX12_00970 [Actinobacteria bacterium]|nr:hypothetical protein [Actinomycetota bacterium]
MKRLISSIVVSVLAAVGVAVVGGPSAYAATPTLVLSGGSAVFGTVPGVIKGTASTAGAVKFSAAGVVIAGCEKAAGSTVLTATLTPTDTAGFTPVDAVPFNVKVGLPVQGAADISPIHIFVDQVLASGSTGVLAPRFGVSCAVTSQFILGQTIVWRVYANNEALGGAVMDSTNTAQAYIEVAGIKDPIQMSYGNHSGVAFWTGVLATGAAPKYSTLGVINFKVTMIAKDQNTMKVASTKLVRKSADGKQVMVDGRPVYERVSYFKTVAVSPALKGSVGTWQSNFTASSQLTLYAVPTV